MFQVWGATTRKLQYECIASLFLFYLFVCFICISHTNKHHFMVAILRKSGLASCSLILFLRLILTFLTVSVNVYLAQKSKPYFYCNSFVSCQPAFIIFGRCTLYEISNWRMYI